VFHSELFTCKTSIKYCRELLIIRCSVSSTLPCKVRTTIIVKSKLLTVELPCSSLCFSALHSRSTLQICPTASDCCNQLCYLFYVICRIILCAKTWIVILLIVDLRKQACQLENELDLKLVSFSKLGTDYSCVRDYGSQIKSVMMHCYRFNLRKCW